MASGPRDLAPCGIGLQYPHRAESHMGRFTAAVSVRSWQSINPKGSLDLAGEAF